ncbi:chromosome partitioning protein [Terracoccus luteus]|uniref:Chromosome partitioning protein n=1 Tax=Terracoccus luteus TaxID=53356 RepID=A0A839PVG0_9MICO|nr:chromosome partitioning protein [Terracoccus luteus]MCP2172910.1 chromosome partitioning protein [Terracoccus luteus]
MSEQQRLGWLSEPEPDEARRLLGWSLRAVSRETRKSALVTETSAAGDPAGDSADTAASQPAVPSVASSVASFRPSTDGREPAVDRPASRVTTDEVSDLANDTASPRPADDAAAVVAPSVSARALDGDRVLPPTPEGKVADIEPSRDSGARPAEPGSAATTVNTTTETAPETIAVGNARPAAASAVETDVEPVASLRAEPVPASESTVASDDDTSRAAVASVIPPMDGDTPLARELADNARRRIALTGRRFPVPTGPRVLTVSNQKGGVGKTTTTVNIAAAMAQSGLRVLVIDLDPQGNASTALGIEHHAEVPSIYDVLVEGTPLADVVQPCPTVDGLFGAPATIDLAGAEIELVSLVAREMRLGRALQAATRAGLAFDYVFIDCPPSLGLLTVNAMVAASEVFIPIQCEYYALEGLSQLLKNIELIRSHLNPDLHVSTILLTMYDGRTRLSAQVADEVRAHFPAEVLRTTVPRSVRISEAPSFGETVMTYDAASTGALAYLEAASEIADRGAQGGT